MFRPWPGADSGSIVVGAARTALWLLVLTVVVGCGPSETSRSIAPSASSAGTAEPASPETGPLIAFLGDSITAGFGVEREEAFPAVAQRVLGRRKVEFRLLNAGRSGDTTAGGLARVAWILAPSPELVVVELGGNDGLRGQPLEEIESNLRALVAEIQEAGATALLLGMRIPTSYGEEYAEGFAQLYPDLARELGVEVVPFFMEPVAGRAEFNQPDGLHPTAEGHRILGEKLAPVIERWLRERRAGRGGSRVPEGR